MKIKKLSLKNFMLFSELELPVSGGINIIVGDNSTGKTALLKTMYTVLCAYSKVQEDSTKEEVELSFAKKFQGVFRPDQKSIGRLTSRKQGRNKTHIEIETEGKDRITINFGTQSTKRAEVGLPSRTGISSKKKFQPIYFPPKEIISATENFSSLYEEYHIAFEETYYDLARLLDRPLKKGANTAQQNQVLQKFEDIMDGKVVQRDKKFYLNVQGAGEFEMGLVSEGYRKLATILYLISSGSLDKNSVLFWDEPETNMNPRMIRPIAEAIMELAKMGVQVFIATHDYFMMQEFNLAAMYKIDKKSAVDVQFISLHKEERGQVIAECAKSATELKRNLIMEEFDELYDREQDLIDKA